MNSVCNSSYSFIPSPLKLYSCLVHGLKMCIMFGYNPQIILCHFFHKMHLVIFPLQVFRLWSEDMFNPSIIFVTFLQVELSRFQALLHSK